jgi:diacylglycerol kinase (ATP)
MTADLVIYNPVAGNGRVQAYWPAVESALRQAGVEFDAVATNEPLEAMTLAEHAAPRYEAVIGVGGDGTVHEIVNGLLRASGQTETIPMGVIPLGNGDDFAKVIPPETPIGGKAFDWRLAVEKIARGQTQLFDIGRMVGDHLRPEFGDGPHYFMNGMDVGFGAQTALNYMTLPRFLKGLSAYLAAILRTLIDYRIPVLCFQLDDQPSFEQATTMTAITNGRCFGNGFWVCPDACADDGLFDVMMAQGVGRVTIMRLIPKIMKGVHTNEPILQMYRARRVVIESGEPFVVEADGEIPYRETQHLEVEILPKRLRVIV